MTDLDADAPVATAIAGRQRGGRWFAQVGWRHLVGLLAVAFSLFPILFVLSAALNPLGTLTSTELVPDRASLRELRQPVRPTPRSPHWFLNSLLIAGLAASAVGLPVGAARRTPSAGCGSAAGGSGCSRCC